MKQKFLSIVGFFALACGLNSFANAAIIVSFNQTSATTSQNVVVQVFASATAATESVGAYGFSVNLGAGVSALNATFAGQSLSATSGQTNWTALENGNGNGNTASSFSGNTVFFRGGGITNEAGFPSQPHFVTIGTGQSNPGTFIGTVSFTALTNYTAFVPTVTAIATGLPGAGTGFVGQGPGFAAITLNTNTGANGTITAVPEPSSIALIGLCVGGLGFRMIRARRNRKA